MMGSKKGGSIARVPGDSTMMAQNNLSLFKQEQQMSKQREQEQILKSEEYHVVKTKDFDVYGRLRPDQPLVRSTMKSSAQPELNEKFITTDCITDRRVKISSMAARQYMNAPSIEDVRKQGQHQMILSAINKKQTFGDLINQANSMVTSVLHDPLKRSLNVMPARVNFNKVKQGGAVDIMVTMKNEDSMAQRVTVKAATDKRLKIQQLEFGPIAPGMLRKVLITLTASEEGPIKDELKIKTKHDKFRVPIEGQVLSERAYEENLREEEALKGRTAAM